MRYLENIVNVKYFRPGRDGGLVVPFGKVVIADKFSDIKHEGYAIVEEQLEKEKCIIAKKGANVTFSVPDNFDKLIYDPSETRGGVQKESIEFWVAKDANGSEFIICRFRLYRDFGSRRSYWGMRSLYPMWYYDLICYHDGEFYRLAGPEHWSVENQDGIRTEGYYEPYFTLVRKIEKTGNDIRRYIVVVKNDRLKKLTYYHKSEPINTSSLNPNMVSWREYNILATPEALEKDMATFRDRLYFTTDVEKYAVEFVCRDK